MISFLFVIMAWIAGTVLGWLSHRDISRHKIQNSTYTDKVKKDLIEL